MPEPFKEMYNRAVVEQLSQDIAAQSPEFPGSKFEAFILDSGWKTTELKGRMNKIAFAFGKFVPGTYSQQLQLLRTIAPAYSGFPAALFPDFVAQYGLNHFEESVDALRFFTPLGTSEFAVRPFIIAFGARMMHEMNRWADDENEHVRRLATEGCRPRLPWGIGLPEFKKNPTPVLQILEKLKEDSSEYVRRSVANNLNDICKDHPETAKKTARSWKGISPETDAIIRHGLRTLLKKGDPEALEIVGFNQLANIQTSGFKTLPEKLKIGERLSLEMSLKNADSASHPIRLEYAITFVNRSGRGGRKVFQWGKKQLAPGEELSVLKQHAFKDVSIRKHFPGVHTIEFIVNGKIVEVQTVEVENS